MIQKDKIHGTLLGTAVGDALGMPIEGLSHQNVRTYYKGVKEYRDDDQRKDLKAGQWTDDTQFTFAIVRALADGTELPGLCDRIASEYVKMRADARRWGPTTTAAVEKLAAGESWEKSGGAEHPTNGAAMRAAPLGLWWAVADPDPADAFDMLEQTLGITHRHPCALVAGIGQAFAVREAALGSVSAFDGRSFFNRVLEKTEWAERQFDQRDTRNSERMYQMRGHLKEYPLDLAEICEGTGISAHESWPYAVAMVARAPHLLEATLLSGVNVGGDADTTGAMMGAILGALHGWQAFPDEWQQELEAADELLAQADRLAGRLGPRG